MNNQLIFNQAFSVPNFKAQLAKNQYTIVHQKALTAQPRVRGDFRLERQMIEHIDWWGRITYPVVLLLFLMTVLYRYHF